MSKIILRSYQEQLIENLRVKFSLGLKRLLAVAPTGSGKTVMFSYMASAAAAKGLNVLILAHREELLFQISETLGEFKCDHSFIMPGVIIDQRQKVQVGSVFTVINNIGKFKNPDLIIIDEAHHFASGNTWSKVIANFPGVRIVGVTATPCRLDGKPLNDCFESLVLGPSVADLIKEGALSDYVAFTPDLVTVDELKITAGDYNKGQMDLMMNKPAITGDAIKEWFKLAKGKKTIVFCVTVEHAKNVAEAFMSAGVSARAVDGAMDKLTRRQILDDFKSGKIEVLTNVNIFTEGFDCKTIECVMLLRPTASLSMYLQMIGRGLRVFPGKGKAILIDHVRAIETHGLPDEEQAWSLSDRIKRRKKIDGKNVSPVKVCTTCFAANQSLNLFCTYCGAPFEIKKRSGPDNIDGELKELNKEEFKKKRKKQQNPATTLEGLIELGIKRGYKNPHAWAKHVMSGRQQRK